MYFPYDPEPHPCFPQPSNANIKIWRYMPLIKLVALLDSRSLHFARADALGDSFEGSGSRASATADPRYALYNDLQRGALLKLDRGSVAINCWHMNEHESAAMWSLYSGEGIAVQSTFDRYTRALPQKTDEPGAETILVGMVRYIDYDREHFEVSNNAYSRFMHKRMSFAHEREVRGVLMLLGSDWDESVEVERIGMNLVKPGVPAAGIGVPVDLDTLIERIYVAPTMPSWAMRAVSAVVARFGISAPVQQSVLNEDPIW